MNGFVSVFKRELKSYFSTPLAYVFLVPAMAMRLWAEERRSNSVELLFTLPITIPQAVLAKFFAAWTVLALALALTCPMIFTVCYLGDPDWGAIITGYAGSLLLAGAYLAIGSFFSSLSRNQVIAFVLAVVACAVFLYAGSPAVMDMLVSFLPVRLVEALEALSFRLRFESIQRGMLQLQDVAFFVLLAAGWLWANMIALKERMAAG